MIHQNQSLCFFRSSGGSSDIRGLSGIFEYLCFHVGEFSRRLWRHDCFCTDGRRYGGTKSPCAVVCRGACGRTEPSLSEPGPSPAHVSFHYITWWITPQGHSLTTQTSGLISGLCRRLYPNITASSVNLRAVCRRWKITNSWFIWFTEWPHRAEDIFSFALILLVFWCFIHVH